MPRLQKIFNILYRVHVISEYNIIKCDEIQASLPSIILESDITDAAIHATPIAYQVVQRRKIKCCVLL